MRFSQIIEDAYRDRRTPDFSLVKKVLEQLSYSDGFLYNGTIYKLKNDQLVFVHAENGHSLRPQRAEDVEVIVPGYIAPGHQVVRAGR